MVIRAFQQNRVDKSVSDLQINTHWSNRIRQSFSIGGEDLKI